MKRGIFKTAALAACVALHASAAESPSGNGDGSNADLFSGILKHPAPSKVVAILAWGEHTMGPNIQRQTTFIRRVATEAERRIAEQNAAAYLRPTLTSPKGRAEENEKVLGGPDYEDQTGAETRAESP